MLRRLRSQWQGAVCGRCWRQCSQPVSGPHGRAAVALRSADRDIRHRVGAEVIFGHSLWAAVAMLCVAALGLTSGTPAFSVSARFRAVGPVPPDDGHRRAVCRPVRGKPPPAQQTFLSPTMTVVLDNAARPP